MVLFSCVWHIDFWFLSLFSHPLLQASIRAEAAWSDCVVSRRNRQLVQVTLAPLLNSVAVHPNRANSSTMIRTALASAIFWRNYAEWASPPACNPSVPAFAACMPRSPNTNRERVRLESGRDCARVTD